MKELELLETLMKELELLETLRNVKEKTNNLIEKNNKQAEINEVRKKELISEYATLQSEVIYHLSNYNSQPTEKINRLNEIQTELPNLDTQKVYSWDIIDKLDEIENYIKEKANM